MHVTSRKRLLLFSMRYPEVRSALDAWYRIVKRTEFASFAELRRTFPSADHVDKYTVFNIGGNKVHLIAVIHYKARRLFIWEILTHAEYNKNRWKG